MARDRIPLGTDQLIGSFHVLGATSAWPTHWPEWVVYTIFESLHRISVPLYVGVTNNCANRFTQHRRDKAWWPLAGDVTLHGFYADRGDAYEAEEQQIHALRPLLNIACNMHSVESAG